MTESRTATAARHKANQRSASRRRNVLWTLGVLAFILLAAIAAWLYLNRERPVTTLNVAAGPYRSDSYELMREIADVVQRQSDILRIEVIPTKDSSQNIALLNAGKVSIRRNEDGLLSFANDVATLESDLENPGRVLNPGPEDALQTRNNDTEHMPVHMATIRSDTPVSSRIQLIAELFPDYFQIFTGDDTDIRRFKHLQGKRVGIPLFGTDEFRSFWAIADHYDVSISSIKWRAMRFEDAADQLLNGDLDAIFAVRSLRDRLILNLYEDAALKGQNLKLVEIDQAPAISIKRPFLRALTMPKGTYSGSPATPLRELMTASVTRNLVTREDVDTELINELTRILFENRLDLVIRFALASAIQRPDLDAGTQVPLHEGAERFYNRDQPSFLQENAEPIALMITIAAMLGSGLLALRSRLTNSQKNRMDSYNYMLLDIADRARNSTDLIALKEMRNELYGILETVVRALDTDEVTEEGFQSFSLLWESVREVIRDRQNDLRASA